jgi:hypothetical protein
MSEKDIKILSQIKILEYMVQRQYMFMYGQYGWNIPSIREHHKRLKEHIDSEFFPTTDASQSMLLAGALGDALSDFLIGLEEMIENSNKFPKT